MTEKLADWLNDRWTWAAIGLLTGYFGFGSSDALEWQAWQEAGIAVASLVLILVRDQKRRPVKPKPKPKSGWNDASEIPPIELVGTSESGPASSTEYADVRDPVLDRRGADVVADGVQRVPPRARSNTAEAIDREPHGFGDRD